MSPAAMLSSPLLRNLPGDDDDDVVSCCCCAVHKKGIRKISKTENNIFMNLLVLLLAWCCGYRADDENMEVMKQKRKTRGTVFVGLSVMTQRPG
jgi:hypothetical protein